MVLFVSFFVRFVWIFFFLRTLHYSVAGQPAFWWGWRSFPTVREKVSAGGREGRARHRGRNGASGGGFLRGGRGLLISCVAVLV